MLYEKTARTHQSLLGENRWQLASSSDHDIRAELFAFAVPHRLTLLELREEAYSVEEVFQQLTK